LIMDEAIKNRIVIILAVLSTIFFFSTLSSCNNATRQRAARDKEMAARLALEEKTSKYAQERSALEEKAKAKEKEVQELKSTLEIVQKSLAQEQLVSQSLKEELEKAAKLKVTPEKGSGQVLADGKKPKK
jgi:hypothetical protein